LQGSPGARRWLRALDATVEALPRKGTVPLRSLALVTWLALALVLAGHASARSLLLYEWLLIVVTVLATVACLMSFGFSRRWRLLLAIAAVLHLCVMTLRFIAHLSMRGGEVPLLTAISDQMWLFWRLQVHLLSEGHFVAGLSVTFFEWLMPLIQILILVYVAASNSGVQPTPASGRG